MGQNKAQLVIDKLTRESFMRARDIEALGVSREYIGKLFRHGIIDRVGRGLYAMPGHKFSINHSIAQACKRVPHGVICLLSSLRFHSLTTQAPFEVWMAIDSKARKPKNTGSPLRIVRFSGKALADGIEEHKIEGIKVLVYSEAKTVADCFKYRNKIGLDVALEALKEGWRERRFTMDELWKYAKVCRVTEFMRPYLESISL